MSQMSRTEAPPRDLRLLVVQRQDADRRLLSALRRQKGSCRFRLVRAVSLRRALGALARGRFDAILLDLDMPGGQGPDAVATLTDVAPELPIVVLTASDDEAAAAEILRRGAQDHLLRGCCDAHLLARALRYAVERKRSERAILYLSRHDPLTRLPNRSHLQERLTLALARARQASHSVAALFLDLDCFKKVNDTLGRGAGDRLLMEVSERLKASLRESDSLARTGGDEFGLVLCELARAEEAGRLAEAMLEALRRPFVVEGHELIVSASLGISIYPWDGEDAETLLRHADIAMARSKHRGRDTHSFYSPALEMRSGERLSIETGLRHALDRGEFLLHYQPLVSLQGGRIAGFEALLRWQHPQLGLLRPDRFLPVAEVSGLIGPIGEWALREACLRARGWQRPGASPIQIAVNLSSRQINQSRLSSVISQALRDSNLGPQLLELELTEHGIMIDPEAAALSLQDLRAAGVRVTIDDFGTGYSSLRHLREFPIDHLKIDQSFLRDAGSRSPGAAIVSAIISMAHDLSIEVTAEGVETAEQLSFLRSRKCDRAQGYLFSQPLPIEEVEALLAARRL
jgi:diguanylate cyclase (GGDEF)-like protein